MSADERIGVLVDVRPLRPCTPNYSPVGCIAELGAESFTAVDNVFAVSCQRNLTTPMKKVRRCISMLITPRCRRMEWYPLRSSKKLQATLLAIVLSLSVPQATAGTPSLPNNSSCCNMLLAAPMSPCKKPRKYLREDCWPLNSRTSSPRPSYSRASWCRKQAFSVFSVD